MERLKMQTPNMAEENFKKLKELFPEAVTEVEVDGVIKPAIDKDVLQQLISNEVVEGPKERYQFTWPGKREAIILAKDGTTKTLRPIKGENTKDDFLFNNTNNLYIEGDNLDVLKILEPKYCGRVKMIYIDPPYNTGTDSFLYPDDYSISEKEYKIRSGQVDENGLRQFKENTEGNPRFHSDWISMMYPRLIKARNLLSDDGVIFISIDDVELINLSKICDEIFSRDNFIATFVRKNKAGSGHDSSNIAIEFDYILCYCKKYSSCRINKEPVDTDADSKYRLSDEYVKKRGRYYLRDLDYKGSYSEKMDYPIETPDKTIIYSGGKFGKPNTWRWSKEKFLWGLKNDYIVFKQSSNGWKVYIKQYQFVDNNGNEYERSIPYRALIDYSNGQGTLDFNSIMETNVFPYPKSVDLLKHLCKIASDKDSIILDFFSGSATTAHAVMQLNAEDGGHRKFIMVQLPEPCDEKSEAYKAGYRNICEIGKERIRRAGKKILEEYKNTPFCKGGCQAKPDRGIFDYNAEVESNAENENLSVSLCSTSPLKKGSLDCHADKSARNDDDCTGVSNTLSLNKVSSSSVTLSACKQATSPQGEALKENPPAAKAASPFTKGGLDVGFRVLRLDSSNMKDVFYRPRDLKKDDLLSYTSNIKEDRTDLDLLFQAMPEIAGADYDAKIDEITISNKKVFKVNNNYIVACFEESINEEVIREIAKLKPYHAIFRDSSFPNDSLLANLEQIFRIESPDTEITVL